MKRFLQRKLPALALALVLLMGTVPMAAAAVVWQGGDPTCPHTSTTLAVYQEPTCEIPGIRVYTCNDCDAVGVEDLSTSSHTFLYYSYNDSYHWRVCSKCGAMDTASRGTHIDWNADGRCDVCSAAVGGAASREKITYQVRAGSYVRFDEDDFADLFRLTYPGYSLQYVVFNNPGSSAFANGSLYYDYGGSYQAVLPANGLSSYAFYYGTSTSSRMSLDALSFVAGSGFTGDVTLTFRAYSDSSRYVDGSVTISSNGSAVQRGISYQVRPGGLVELDEDDFSSFFRSAYPGYNLQYVVFGTPSTAAFANGTMYYDYGGTYQTPLSRSSLGSYTFYYGVSTSSRYMSLDALTFAADSGFTGSVTLSFRAYSDSSRYVDGYVTISSNGISAQDTITYQVQPGGRVALDEDDFSGVFRRSYPASNLQYVVFDTPATSAFSNGTLYYNYGSQGQLALSRTDLARYTFFYNPASIYQYDLDALTFAADSGFAGDVTLTFRAYSDSGRFVNGAVKFSAAQTASASMGGDIRYTGTYSNKVQINANDIARFFSKSYPGSTLQYVTLGGVPATGSLYYNYYGASQYGTTSSQRLSAANYNSQVFYFSPSSTSQYALTELTYVPSGYNYCDVIPFTAYGSGAQSVSGSILISVNPSAVSEVYGVTQRNTSVNFPASSIAGAVSTATGITPSSIQLLRLPSSSQGAVYEGSGTALASTKTLYAYGSGTQQLSQLRFVPNSSYTGSVEIPYVAYNSSGTAYASGLFSMGVVNSARSFKDVSSSTWCYKYVVELSDANVIDGYADGSFKPDSTVTYGAALKLIMLAAGYPEQAPVSSNVFSGYLAKARAEGIITRSDVDLTKPITRLQVAQIAAGAMKLDTSSLSSVQPFTDTTDPAVRALNAAGIVEGYFSNGTSTYRPSNTLTRGQLSAIVWRMEQYDK